MQIRTFLTAFGAVAVALAAGAVDAQTTTTASTGAAASTGLQTVAVPVGANQLSQARQKAANYCSNFGKAAEFQGIRQQRNGGELAYFACI
jgi:hypothetical protein